MRLHTVIGPGQAFTTVKPIRISDELTIPAGVLAAVPFHAMFTTSRLWDRPNDFIPGIVLLAPNKLAPLLCTCLDSYSSCVRPQIG